MSVFHIIISSCG